MAHRSRSSTEDTMVAIVSLGATRTFAHLRPRPVRRIRHHHGDLLVMGGSCRTWEHAIPKTTRPIGPRISIQFRPRDVALNGDAISLRGAGIRGRLRRVRILLLGSISGPDSGWPLIGLPVVVSISAVIACIPGDIGGLTLRGLRGLLGLRSVECFRGRQGLAGVGSDVASAVVASATDSWEMTVPVSSPAPATATPPVPVAGF
jgi:hypothetical protein